MIIPQGLLIQADHLVTIANICYSYSDGNRIKAIKLFRECTGLGLKPAKDMIWSVSNANGDKTTPPRHAALMILNNYVI